MSFNEDPTQGIEHGSIPGEDPVGGRAADTSIDPALGREVGEQPYEDPTQGTELGAGAYEDPTQGAELGSLPREDPTADSDLSP